MAASTLDEIDPLYVVMAREIYGQDVDVRALWDVSKSMPDTSGVHAPTSPKKEKKIAAVGLGATGVAAVGGLHAVHATLDAAKKSKTIAGATGAERAVPKMLRKLPVKPSTAAAIGTAGWLGLHATELVGDSLAARAQVKQLKQNGRSVTKGFGRIKIPHVQPEALVRADSRARRNGLRLVGATGVAASAGGGYAVGRHTTFPHAKPSTTGEVTKILAKHVSRVDVELSEISKFIEDKQQVFGWFSIAKIDGKPVIDLQSDVIDIDEIEKAAYQYVLSSRVGGDMHSRVQKFDAGPVHTADLIESMVFTPEKIAAMGLPEDFPQGWWGGMQVNDHQQWLDVKNKKRLGFSVHGSGQRREVVMA